MKITTTLISLLMAMTAMATTPHKYRLVWQDHFKGTTYDGK